MHGEALRTFLQEHQPLAEPSASDSHPAGARIRVQPLRQKVRTPSSPNGTRSIAHERLCDVSLQLRRLLPTVQEAQQFEGTLLEGAQQLGHLLVQLRGVRLEIQNVERTEAASRT